MNDVNILSPTISPHNDLTEVIEYYNENILPILDKINDYKLIYIGGIGVGKSTIIKIILEIFKDLKPRVIHEYLEANKELGETLLSAFIKKQISPTTFQHAILDIYEEQLENIYNKNENVNENINKSISVTSMRNKENDKNENVKLTIYERIPDDNLTIFSNLSCKNNEISLSSFNDLYLRTIELDKKYSLPSYLIKSPTTKFIKITSTGILDLTLLTLQIIKNDILSGTKCRIIGLSANIDICKFHIRRRHRKDENKYSDEYLNSIVKTYNNLYSVIEKNNYNINLLNIGQFVN